MFGNRNPFRQLSKRNKVVLATVLGSVLFLSTLTPVLNIRLLPSSLLPAVTAAPSDKAAEKVPPQAKAGMEKAQGEKFHLEEASISDIHKAIQSNEITCTELVQAYIDRAKAYNGVCTQLLTEDGAPIPPTTGYVRAGAPIEFPTETVPISSILPNFDQYIGLPIDLGRMEATASDPSVQQQFGMRVGIPDAGQLNALETINIRGERSVTCKGAFDAHPSTGPLPAGAPPGCEEFRQHPDALERAAELDAQYGSNPDLKKLPMYCIPFSFKDSFDTKDMRTTASADVNYAMDAPPKDGTIADELRAKGAIIYAKAASNEYNAGPGNPGGPATATKVFLGGRTHSTWSGVACNPYDTERATGESSTGSGVSVAANLVVCSICEETGGSCHDPGGKNGVVSLRTTKEIISYGGAIGSTPYQDTAGIHCRTVKDAAIVLDALKDPQLGYFDSRDIYTALPKALISEEPYANFIVDDKDLKGKSKALEGMRIGVVREWMIKPVQNDVAMSDQINNEIKSVLRDKLGAELVESVDPLYPDDPTIPNMKYTFQDAIAEILPTLMPEYFSKTVAGGALEFAVPGYDVTTYDYMLKLTKGSAPLSDNLNLRRITTGAPNALTFKFQMEQYLLDRGDERVKDWASLFANAKWLSDTERAGAENWLHTDTIVSDGKTERMTMRDVQRLVLLKVMHENDIDVFVQPIHTIPQAKIGGPSEPNIKDRGGLFPRCFVCSAGIPEIVVPAGFNQVVYEPQFALSADKKNYISVTGTVQSLLPHPMPIGIGFMAGPGEEPVLIRVASAYEAATHHRMSPPDFRPLPGEP
jgi:Asp-tRNA(Asn)/Glu-tRNA(Gln) amidotransferase A subunit family amidase